MGTTVAVRRVALYLLILSVAAVHLAGRAHFLGRLFMKSIIIKSFYGVEALEVCIFGKMHKCCEL